MRRNSLFTSIMVLLCGQLLAAVPTAINYQGRLTNAGGAAIPDGSYSIVFTIYDAASGGTSKWTETQSVTTSGGLFAVLLGTITPITDTVFNGTDRYLGVKVGANPELSPRIPLVTVPYSERVSTVDGSTGGGIAGNIYLDSSTTTTGNVFKGGYLLMHNSGTDNTFIGITAGNLVTPGMWNTGIGAYALRDNTTGVDNTAIGRGALVLNTTGAENTSAGSEALYNNISGGGNTASGSNALNKNTSGGGNSAFGYNSLRDNITGIGNTGSGVQALIHNDGDGNTACGTLSLGNNTTGTFNTALGYHADVSSGDLTNATAIGATAVVNASNKVRIGNTSVTKIEGQVAYTFISDRNQKEGFQFVDGDNLLRKICGLSLTSWNYKTNDPRQFRHYGPVAQEFFAAFGHDAVGQCGDSTSINSGDEMGILMIAVQTLEKRTAEIRTLKERNAELTARLDKMEATLNKIVSNAIGNSVQLGQK